LTTFTFVALQIQGLSNLIISPSTYEEENKGLVDKLDVYKYITDIAVGKVKQVKLFTVCYIMY